MVKKDYLLDTNVVSAIIKKNEIVQRKLEDISFEKRGVFISGITYYEVKRGLIASNATRKLAEFERICKRTPVIFWNDIAILEKAAEIHAYLKKRGMRLEDADIFIAAIAIGARISFGFSRLGSAASSRADCRKLAGNGGIRP